MLYTIVALLVVVLDQWVKLWVTTNKTLLPLTLIPNVVSLVHAENAGGAFGFLKDQNATVFFLAVAGAVALVTIIALATNLVKGGLGRWSLVFITAGGISNAIDRLLSEGKVQDMIKLDFLQKLNINFPIFNIADIFITLFTILLILYIIFGGNAKAASRDEDDEDEDDEDEDEEEDDEDEEEEDEEEEDERPLRRRAALRPAREKKPQPEEPAEKPARSRQSYEEEYERFKARKAREAQHEPEQPKAEPVVDPKDPFAEWDRANRKAGAEPPKSAPKPAPAPVEPPKSAPAPAPKSAPKSAPAEEEFSLEDILAEFR